jgi:hypothetical protein
MIENAHTIKDCDVTTIYLTIGDPMHSAIFLIRE